MQDACVFDKKQLQVFGSLVLRSYGLVACHPTFEGEMDPQGDSTGPYGEGKPEQSSGGRVAGWQGEGGQARSGRPRLRGPLQPETPLDSHAALQRMYTAFVHTRLNGSMKLPSCQWQGHLQELNFLVISNVTAQACFLWVLMQGSYAEAGKANKPTSSPAALRAVPMITAAACSPKQDKSDRSPSVLLAPFSHIDTSSSSSSNNESSTQAAATHRSVCAGPGLSGDPVQLP